MMGPFLLATLFFVLGVPAAPSARSLLFYNLNPLPQWANAFRKPPKAPQAPVLGPSPDCEGFMDCYFESLLITEKEVTVPAPLSPLHAKIKGLSLSFVDTGDLSTSVTDNEIQTKLSGFNIVVKGPVEYTYGPFSGTTEITAVVDKTDFMATVDLLQTRGQVDAAKLNSCQMNFSLSSLNFSTSVETSALGVLKMGLTSFLNNEISTVVCGDLSPAIDGATTKMIRKFDPTDVVPSSNALLTFLSYAMNGPIPDAETEFPAKLKTSFHNLTMERLPTGSINTTFSGNLVSFTTNGIGMKVRGTVHHKQGPLSGVTDVTAVINRMQLQTIVEILYKNGKFDRTKLQSCELDIQYMSVDSSPKPADRVINAIKTFLHIEVKQEVCSNVANGVHSDPIGVFHQIHALFYHVGGIFF